MKIRNVFIKNTEHKFCFVDVLKSNLNAYKITHLMKIFVNALFQVCNTVAYRT